jgi:hypothetical protein
MTTEVFTASEIASALGVSPQRVRNILAGVPPNGSKTARGQVADAWSLDSIPASLTQRLQAIQDGKNYRSLHDVLNGRSERYVPRDETGEIIPLSQIHQDDIDDARLLQRALERVLQHPEWRGQELDEAGLSDFRRVFGREVSASRWGYLHRRTIMRDGGLREWHRIELYICEAPKRITIKKSFPTISLELLETALGKIDPSTLSIEEKDLIWLRACDQLAELEEQGVASEAAKRAILDCLYAAGCVGKNRPALQRSFQRKWRAFHEADGKPSAIQDKRKQANVERRKILPECDRPKIIAAVVDTEGRVSQGWREVMDSGTLSVETTQRFIGNPTRKSYVPHSIRNDVTLDAKKALEARRRPRNAALNGAYVPRKLDGLFAGDSFTADDCTCPVYYWEPSTTDPRGFRVLRGQFIPMMDERSTLVLSFALHSERNYNSRVIRSLITKVHDDWGLPRRRFRFEKGVWKSSKILKGDELETEHTEMGLREFGIKFSHAELAHGKPIVERGLGMLQNKMERLPGYASRNEITQPNEILAKQLREIEAGKVHPSTYLKSRDEWVQILNAIIIEYNSTPQEGKYCKGLTPLQCWNRNQNPSDPMVHLGLHARYLLANHRLSLKVSPKGIKLRDSLGGGLYVNADTGRLAGEKVLVWVNPDQLDYIAVTDLKRTQRPVFVPRIEVPAIDGVEQYKAIKGHVSAHNDYGRTVFVSIRPHLADHSFRKLAADRATIQMGEQFEAGLERVKAERATKATVAKRISKLSRDLGISAPRMDDKHATRQARGIELISKALEIADQENL